jgi:hypothetical protein
LHWPFPWPPLPLPPPPPQPPPPSPLPSLLPSLLPLLLLLLLSVFMPFYASSFDWQSELFAKLLFSSYCILRRGCFFGGCHTILCVGGFANIQKRKPYVRPTLCMTYVVEIRLKTPTVTITFFGRVFKFLYTGVQFPPLKFGSCRIFRYTHCAWAGGTFFLLS